MGYRNCKLVENLPSSRKLFLPRTGSQTVSLTFVYSLLHVVAADTSDYMTVGELVERMNRGERFSTDPHAAPRYWYGSWTLLASRMWLPQSPATRNRIRRAWMALSDMGIARRYCERVGATWRYSHMLMLGSDGESEYEVGMDDAAVDDDVASRILSANPNLREWPYRRADANR